MNVQQHLDKDNLHHAYLIEGERKDILSEIFSFMETLGIKTTNNPDFCEIHIDNFKMDEAILLRSMTDEKGFSSDKKIFIISANQFSLDAEQALLKMFEEPKKDTHFFLIIPDKNALLDTLVS
jgi:DNA polymerase III delta subunit